jgi:putative flippase GtrA
VQKKLSSLRALFERHREQIMYLIFGGVTTFVSWLVYSICVRGFGLNLYYAQIVSWIIAVLVAFVTNKIWVFESKGWRPLQVLKEMATFIGGRLATGVLEIVATPLLVSWGLDLTLFGVEGLPAKMLVSIVIIILNYIISKFIAFRKSDNTAEE